MWAIEVHGTIDFETYSESGQTFDGSKWVAPPGATKKGISAVGTLAYAEHPSTEVLTLSYKLPGMADVKRWRPGQPNPQDLFDHLAAGGLIEAHNVMFERGIWHHVCRRRYGWPDLPARQLRCSAAKARVNSLPGALGALTSVLPVTTRKNTDGTRLINKFSVPQKPTKNKPDLRIHPDQDLEDGEKLYAYCDDDVLAEEEASAIMMPMSEAELEFWLLDQDINWRGVAIDREGVRNMISILDQVQAKYGEQFRVITGGLEPSQVQAIRNWLYVRGIELATLDSEAVETTLERTDIPDDVRRVLQIRALTGSASVKKLYAMERMANTDNRLRNLIIHHGARTGRPTGDGAQPLNMPKAGPDLVWCEECKGPSKWPPMTCPWCMAVMSPMSKKRKWSHEAVDHVQMVMATRSLDVVEAFFGDALLAISGCLRGMFWADEGMDLIASDYSAIEAVVTAMLAGEQWRIDTFRRMEDIYLVSAAKITGRTLEQYKAYKEDHGDNHPDRQKIGKVAELALGFGGWVGAWLQFAPDGVESEIKENILAWRAASPMIVEMWGGQARGLPWKPDYRLERFGFEGAFVNAVQYPGHTFSSNGIDFYMRGDALIIRLLSGRELTYHNPRLHQSDRGAGLLDITYMTWNSNPKYGPPGWGPMKTYSGRLAENIVQATAHDIQRFGILALEAAGYPIVLHVYDEDVSEVPQGFGSIEEYERIMATMPPWAHDWPIRASGGWRGKRYRKG